MDAEVRKAAQKRIAGLARENHLPSCLPQSLDIKAPELLDLPSTIETIENLDRSDRSTLVSQSQH